MQFKTRRHIGSLIHVRMGHHAQPASEPVQNLLPYWRNEHGLIWLLPDATDALVDFQPTSRLRFDDLEAIADTAAEGMGVAWLPYWLIRDRMRRGELVEIWGERPTAVMECYAVWPAAQYLPLRSRLAIDALVAELPKCLED